MRKSLLILALLSSANTMSYASTETLTFTGLKNLEPILNFYNGGTGGLGTTGGQNYGISFSSDSLAVVSQMDGGTGNFSNVPAPGLNTTAFFLNGAGDTMDVASGFNTGFSFFYAAANTPGTVSVFSGLDGMGTLLYTFNLAVNGSGCDRSGQPYDCWTEQGIGFAGTARSVVFGGSANYIAFADVTLGASTVVPVAATPEPSTLLMAGSGLLGLAGAVRRRLVRA